MWGTSNQLRHIGMTLVWMLCVVLAVGVGLWAVVDHYLAAEAALRLVLKEQPELYRDGLLGEILGAFLPNATLTQALALTLAVVETLSIFFFFNLLGTGSNLLKVRVRASRGGDEAEKAEATLQLWTTAVSMTVFAALLGVVLWYDYNLMRFRTLAGALGLASSSQAIDVPYWDQVTGPMRYTVYLASCGAWAYVALTMLAAYGFEFALDRLADRFTLAWAPIDARRAGKRPGGHQGQADEGAPDGAELSVDDAQAGWVESEAGLSDAPVEDPVAIPGGPLVGIDATPGSGPVPEPPGPLGPDEPVVPTSRPVIGGDPGETVTLGEAQQQPDRYYVDPVTLRVWQRALWDAMQTSPVVS